MKKLTLIIAIVFSGMLFLASCSKQNAEPQQPQPQHLVKIIKTQMLGVDTVPQIAFEFEYQNNKISKVKTYVQGNVNTVYNYSNGLIESSIREVNGGVEPIIYESIFSHYPDYIEQTKYKNGQLDGVIKHKLDENNNVYEITYRSGENVNFINTWNHNNLVSIYENYIQSEIILDYDSQSNVLQDIFIPYSTPRYSQDMTSTFKWALLNTKNNVKSLTNDNGFEYYQFNYEYNDNGTPKSMQSHNTIGVVSDEIFYYEYY